MPGACQRLGECGLSSEGEFFKSVFNAVFAGDKAHCGIVIRMDMSVKPSTRPIILPPTPIIQFSDRVSSQEPACEIQYRYIVVQSDSSFVTSRNTATSLVNAPWDNYTNGDRRRTL